MIEIREALEVAKEFIGANILLRGYGDEQYSLILKALKKLDEMESK